MKHTICPNRILSLSDVEQVINNNIQIELSESAKDKIINCRAYLDKKIQNNNSAIYGINTGFGSLCNVSIENEQLNDLQENLVKSHACGTGNQVPEFISKLMLFLKIQAFSYGKSGVSLELVERLIFFFNNGIYPIIFEQGSLGASGDLAPLAHLSLPLIGEGEVNYKGEQLSALEVINKFGLKPLKLKSKEGLALLNGTQFMSAFGAWICIQAEKLYSSANLVAALSLDAYDGRIEPFNELLHKVRPHKGQITTAEFFTRVLSGSEIIKEVKKHVQDPYSFRCIPQVHGASFDTIQYVKGIIETEINSVTDNPTVFPDEDLILSGGNFHGQPLAIAMDFLSIALAEIASISERRTYLLISGQRGLPPFLIKDSGINSGLMITQYTAASIISQNKQLCTPASVDSIVSSNGQEDHVSMGANAATKCFQIVENVWKVLAIECINSTQALDFRRPKKSSKILENFHQRIRLEIPHLKKDEYIHPLIKKSIEIIKDYKYN
ncbi:MAG: histidine ammonia-lyase [Bacteroidota bacterium]|jgi:histidine ammonia-lyase